MAGPLSGLRVMDVCQLAVGPWGASLLGQLGAEVIKIEVPEGDPIRNLLFPTWTASVRTTPPSTSARRNIALDLKNPRDLEIAPQDRRALRRLRRELPPGRDGAPRPRLRGGECAQPGYRLLLLVRLTARAAPAGERAAPTASRASFTGFDSFNGPEGARPENFRSKGHIDHTCSAFVTQTLLAGLCARERFGIAQFIETSMMKATTVYQTSRIAEHFAGGQPAPMGSASDETSCPTRRSGRRTRTSPSASTRRSSGGGSAPHSTCPRSPATRASRTTPPVSSTAPSWSRCSSRPSRGARARTGSQPSRRTVCRADRSSRSRTSGPASTCRPTSRSSSASTPGEP